MMVPRPAQYLLRFDDFCPTMSRAGWERFAPLIDEFGIQPIVAVVPDNQDPELMKQEPDPEFWSRMREMEAAGATIALHGYRHLCNNKGRGLVPLHRRTEFAGVAEPTQLEWIRKGLQILRGHRLNPRLWVAPRHGFDRGTLHALQREGIDCLSDGLSRVPHMRDGMLWIPQQLWGPVRKSTGLWTICIHSTTADEEQVKGLRRFLQENAAQLTSFERVLAESTPGPLVFGERVYEKLAAWRTCASRPRPRR